MKKLHLTFTNSEGKAHKLIPTVAAEDLTEAQVKAAMQQFTELNLFEKDGLVFYQEATSAKYVETIETILF
jgi:hypothetical protein